MQKHQDKINLSELMRKEKVILNLGGGKNRIPGVINVDRIDLPEVDIVADLENGLEFMPDNSVDEIRCRSFLEHIDNLERLMAEIYRVLKKDGLVKIFVPHFTNPYYYSDFTHKRPFGYYTFYYFSKNQRTLLRKVPTFYNNIDFMVVSQKLIFNSVLRRYHLCNRFNEWFFNLNTRLQEIYEAFFSPFTPCYGLEVVLKK